MPDDLNTIYRYHDETKHRPIRYARSLGFMDWSNQPDPFLRFAEVEPVALLRPETAADPGPTWGEVLAGAPAPAAVDTGSVSRLLYGSMALSAWKEVTGPDGRVVSRWSLRVNPSSGNLHPTETWLVLPDGLHHYRPDLHALAHVASGAGWPAGRGLLVGLSSIAWREAWKYGERAFRYCNHDVGHAIAALSLAAASVGWRVRLLDHVPGALAGRLLGCDRRDDGPEADHPDVLLQMGPPDELVGAPTIDEIETLADGLAHGGAPAPLSRSHRDWPVIDKVRAATVWPGHTWMAAAGPPGAPALEDPAPFLPLVRGRRSAVAMDGQTSLPAAEFFRICRRLASFHAPLPWAPQVALALFVHRVTGLEPGLYLLTRHPDQEAELREALRPEATWARPEGCPTDLPLWQLGGGDLRQHARELCCHQDIAADGAFAVAMLARFTAPLAAHGPGFYPRLYWETGLVGQMLYLAAEAAGVQGTGIGCFFDDETHRLLGLGNQDWQSLYHFTVGRGVRDERLRTTPAYPSGG